MSVDFLVVGGGIAGLRRALDLTLRRSVSYLARRTPGHARCRNLLAHQLELARCHYNWLRPHASLRFGHETRTPAMVAGLRVRRLNFRDIFASAGHQQLTA